MSTQTTGSFIKVQSPPNLPSSPPTLHLKKSHATLINVSDSRTSIELQPITPVVGQIPSKTTLIQQESIQVASTPATPRTPTQFEQSRPPTPQQDRAADIAQSFWNPYMNRFRVVACCLMLIGNGLNDAAPGALLNYIET